MPWDPFRGRRCRRRQREDGVGLDFDGAQCGAGIGGEEGVAAAATDDDDLSLLHGLDGATAAHLFADRLDGEAAEEFGAESLFLQFGLESHAVNEGGEHAHVVALDAVHALGGTAKATEDVAAADDDGDFDFVFYCFADVASILFEHGGVDAVALATHEGFAAEF